MEFGIDEYGNRVSIFNAVSEKTYYCPCCKEALVQKHGSMIIHHFAHKSLKNCVDYYDNKGEWHRKMQELFPDRNREVFNDEFGKHFFDVLTDNEIIIEFQNSPIDYESFWDRTNAYCDYSITRKGYKPIWVFNYVRRYFYVFQKGKYSYRNRKVKWYRPTKIFGEYRNNADPYELWFRISPMKYPPETNAYGYITFEDISKLSPAYLKVKGIYNDSLVYGDVYTEHEFEEYILQKGVLIHERLGIPERRTSD